MFGDELRAGWAEEERGLHSARVASVKARAVGEQDVAVPSPGADSPRSKKMELPRDRPMVGVAEYDVGSRGQDLSPVEGDIERDGGPFCSADRSETPRFAVYCRGQKAAPVSGTFERDDKGLGGQPVQIRQAQHQPTLNEACDFEAPGAGVDRRHPEVVAHVEVCLGIATLPMSGGTDVSLLSGSAADHHAFAGSARQCVPQGPLRRATG